MVLGVSVLRAYKPDSVTDALRQNADLAEPADLAENFPRYPLHPFLSAIRCKASIDNHLSSPDVTVGVERLPEFSTNYEYASLYEYTNYIFVVSYLFVVRRELGYRLAPGRVCQTSAVASRFQSQLNTSRE